METEMIRNALIKECSEQARSTLYTSTSFFIWLRTLKRIRGILWTVAAICSIATTSFILLGLLAECKTALAGISLIGAMLAGIIKAVKLDETITAYEQSAARLKNVEGALRRSAEVWSHKNSLDFEAEARSALKELDDARLPSLTPPEWCFRCARRKIRSGHYDSNSE